MRNFGRDEYGFLCEQEWEYPEVEEYPEVNIVDEDIIDEDEVLPSHLGMHKSMLKALGRRRGLNSLYNVPRWDGAGLSRSAAHPCHKDTRRYRPWQRDDMKTPRGVLVPDLNQEELDLEYSWENAPQGWYAPEYLSDALFENHHRCCSDEEEEVEIARIEAEMYHRFNI